MKAKNAKIQYSVGFLTALAAWVTFTSPGCSTTQVTPDPAPAPAVEPPMYLKIPHPTGTDLGDLRAILFDPSVPPPAELAKCDRDFKKLWSVTTNEDERREGVRELLRRDAVFYHWCFYSKIAKLDEDLKTLNYIDEKQRRVLETYQYLVPIARGFSQEYRDSRYLRWAIVQYKRLSTWVFFRKLELTPDQTSELVQVSNPFGLWREPAAATSVLERYGIVETQSSPAVMLPPGATPPPTNEALPEPTVADPGATQAPEELPATSIDMPVGESAPAIEPESK